MESFKPRKSTEQERLARINDPKFHEEQARKARKFHAALALKEREMRVSDPKFHEEQARKAQEFHASLRNAEAHADAGPFEKQEIPVFSDKSPAPEDWRDESGGAVFFNHEKRSAQDLVDHVLSQLPKREALGKNEELIDGEPVHSVSFNLEKRHTHDLADHQLSHLPKPEVSERREEHTVPDAIARTALDDELMAELASGPDIEAASKRLYIRLRHAEHRALEVDAAISELLKDADKYKNALVTLIDYVYENNVNGERFFNRPGTDEFLFIDGDENVISCHGTIEWYGTGSSAQLYIHTLDSYTVLTGPLKGTVFNSKDRPIPARPVKAKQGTDRKATKNSS